MDYKYIISEIEDRILTISIDKEKSLNALNVELISELDHVFKEAHQSNDVDVIILTGKGKAFVAGADISEMVNMSPEESKKFAKDSMEVFTRIEKHKLPVIAAINGFALGGGCELAMSCDIRIASTKAKLGQPEVGLGITPGFGGTQRLSRLVGLGKAKELIFTADIIKADEAYRIGLVDEICEAEELLTVAKEMAKKIKSKSKVAVQLAKQAINTGIQTDIDSAMVIEQNIFALCFASEDQKEGMSAFLEKRPANFKK